MQAHGTPPSIWDAAHAATLSTYPPGSDGPPFACPKSGAPAYLVFQPVGFAMPPSSLMARWSFAPPFHPCLCLAAIGGLLSVALSVTPPSPAAPLPVRKHGALCCPDFPPSPPCGGKSGGAMRGMSRNECPGRLNNAGSRSRWLRGRRSVDRHHQNARHYRTEAPCALLPAGSPRPRHGSRSPVFSSRGSHC